MALRRKGVKINDVKYIIYRHITINCYTNFIEIKNIDIDTCNIIFKLISNLVGN